MREHIACARFAAVILSAYQPAYLPWLGLFHRIALSDTFCIMDTASYSKQNFINRNRIKTAAGALWLTVPVEAYGSRAQRICDVRIASRPWRAKHVASITHAYGKSRYFGRYAPGIFSILEKRHEFLGELTTELLTYFLEELGLRTRIVRASDYRITGKKQDYVLSMCAEFGATAFIFGGRGKAYASAERFREAGIDAYFLEYRHPRYRQLRGAFLPEMAIVDLLFNEGPESLNVILGGNIGTLAEVAGA
jgi:hypothetical protein